MTKLTHLFSLFCLSGFLPICLISAEIPSDQKLPVDISFVAVDLKYNKERGAQICEIQHGFQSSYKGNAFSNEGTCLVAQNLIKELDRFHEFSWLIKNAMFDPSLKMEFLLNKKWNFPVKTSTLTRDKKFLAMASSHVDDPSDINAYHGFVIMHPGLMVNRDSFRKKYPGVICLDNASYNNRRNKYKMTQLLMGHPLTEKHKPKWGIYSLESEDGLANLIYDEIGSDLLVIKPIHNALGNGVIILRKEDLNDVLGYLFKRPEGIVNDDPAYQFWLTADETNFLVEEFINVDPVQAPHLENQWYSPTIRLAFLMIYNKNEIEIVCVGGYYSLPQKSLYEEGTLNERYKTYCKLPFYLKGDPEIMKCAEEDLKDVLRIVYSKMLGLELF